MSSIQKYVCIAASVALAIAVFLFFGLACPYHLHFQEQYQMFLFTWEYFLQVVSCPGGLADYAGRFLTQFFYYAWAGAAIIALIVTAFQVVFFLAAGSRGALPYVASFVPALILWVFLCDENALCGSAVALLVAVTAAYGIAQFKRGIARTSLSLFLCPVLYWICGPAAILYIFLVIRDEKPMAIAAMIALAALSILTAYLTCHIPLENLIYGVHYYRFRTPPIIFWVAVAAALVAGLVVGILKYKAIWAIIAVAIPALLFWVWTSCDFKKETQMKYDFMVRYNMWNRIMQEADKESPSTPLTVSSLNLALAMTGRMGDAMFHYFQNGEEGLLPQFIRDYRMPLPVAEAYWQLGMINTAQRFVFEAQESIPDYQKSARCYCRLAETNIVNGDYEVAERYLNALTHTLFYKKWALSRYALIGDDASVEAHPLYGKLRSFRLKKQDFLFSDSEMYSMLGFLLIENGSNTVAYNYLMAWCLLRKDLQGFEECRSLYNVEKVPQSYQEAFLINWVNTHSSFEGLPGFISRQNASRMNQFIRDHEGGVADSAMKARYGDTYWYYCFH